MNHSASDCVVSKRSQDPEASRERSRRVHSSAQHHDYFFLSLHLSQDRDSNRVLSFIRKPQEVPTNTEHDPAILRQLPPTERHRKHCKLMFNYFTPTAVHFAIRNSGHRRPTTTVTCSRERERGRRSGYGEQRPVEHGSVLTFSL